MLLPDELDPATVDEEPPVTRSLLTLRGCERSLLAGELAHRSAWRMRASLGQMFDRVIADPTADDAPLIAQAVFAQLAAQISSALDRAKSLQSSQRTAKTQEIATVFANRVQSAGTHQKTMTEAASSYQGLLHANQVNIQLGKPPTPSEPSSGMNGHHNGSTNGSKGDKR